MQDLFARNILAPASSLAPSLARVNRRSSLEGRKRQIVEARECVRRLGWTEVQDVTGGRGREAVFVLVSEPVRAAV